METIAQDCLKEIFHFLNNPFYFLLLKQVNKEWKKIIENEIKIENTNTQKYQSYFYSFVNDFVSREDFETLNIQFTFKNNKDLLANFSKFGLLNSVKYLHKQNLITKKIKTRDNHVIFLSEWSCELASSGGQLHVLKYLHENNCPWNEWCWFFAVQDGHLDILKYLRENNCPWYKRSFLIAAKEGHLHILKYLNENRFYCDKYECLKVAKNDEIKEYIEKYT